MKQNNTPIPALVPSASSKVWEIIDREEAVSYLEVLLYLKHCSIFVNPRDSSYFIFDKILTCYDVV